MNKGGICINYSYFGGLSSNRTVPNASQGANEFTLFLVFFQWLRANLEDEKLIVCKSLTQVYAMVTQCLGICLVYARKTIIQTSIGFSMQLIKVEIHEKFASLKRFLDIANEIRQLIENRLDATLPKLQDKLDEIEQSRLLI